MKYPRRSRTSRGYFWFMALVHGFGSWFEVRGSKFKIQDHQSSRSFCVDALVALISRALKNDFIFGKAQNVTLSSTSTPQHLTSTHFVSPQFRLAQK